MAYADVADVSARWRALTDEEQARATVLLEDASAVLDSLMTVDESDQQLAAVLRVVCASMVVRAMSASAADAFGVTQQSMTAGAYTQSWTYSNPTGDLYLTKAEKRMLGIGGGRVGWAPLGGSHV